jgi:hypothetical protein
MRNAIKILVRRPEVERSLGQHWSRWEGSIKIILEKQNVGVWQTSLNTIMNMWAP